MLRKIRQVGEAAGLFTPSETDALQMAEQLRQDLVAAHAAVPAAEHWLEAALDRGATPREIQEGEAKLADARQTAERAQRSYAAGERRLAAARAAAAEKAKAAAILARDAALDGKAAVAVDIDAWAAEGAALRRRSDSLDDALALAAAAGVATGFRGADGETLIQRALSKHGAVTSTWLGDRAKEPGAADIAARDAGAVLAFQT